MGRGERSTIREVSAGKGGELRDLRLVLGARGICIGLRLRGEKTRERGRRGWIKEGAVFQNRERV